MNNDTNPYELGLDRLVDLDMPADFIGKVALHRIRAAGVRRKQVGLRIDGPPLTGPNTTFWPIRVADDTIGKVTSAIHSPRLAQNIALAMVSAGHAELGTVVEVAMPTGSAQATVVERPFFDPKKQLAIG